MIRKAVALALAGMVCLSGPALAADAQASAAKASVAKAAKVDALQRAAAPNGAANMTGDPDFLIFLALGLISTAVVVSAFNNDEAPVSP
ncbi:MAG: hypothetical protein ACM3W4_02145 [Ignavibacteriales bacterium]